MKIYYVILLNKKIVDVSAKYGNDEYLWIDNFLSYIRKNDYRNEFLIVKALYKNILNLNDDMKAFEISSKDKVKYFIVRYLEKCTLEKFDEIVDLMKNDYKKLNIIYNIRYFFDDRKLQSEEKMLDIKNKVLIINDVFDKLCKTIIAKEINLYDDKYYSKNNIFILLDNVHDKMYLKKIVNKDTVYRLLRDLTYEVISSSEGYGYYINNQLFEKYIVNKMDVDIEQYLQLNHPKTESEIFLKDLYYKHKKSYYEHKKDNKDIVIGEGEIYRIKPIKFIV